MVGIGVEMYGGDSGHVRKSDAAEVLEVVVVVAWWWGWVLGYLE